MQYFNVVLLLVKKRQLVISCQQFVGRHLFTSKHVSGESCFCYIVGCEIIAKKIWWTCKLGIDVEFIGRDKDT